MKPEEFKDLLEKLESLGFEAGREAKDNWRGWQKRRDSVVDTLMEEYSRLYARRDDWRLDLGALSGS